MRFQHPADELFIGVWSVDISGIEKRNAKLERAVQRRDRFLFITVAVKIRHAHATEADRRHAWSTASKFALFHICPIQVRGAHSSQRSRIWLRIVLSNGPASN